MTHAAELKELAPSGTLRVGINLSNILLVSGQYDDGTPHGIAPDMAAELAKRVGLPFSLHPIRSAGATADAISNHEVDLGLIAFEEERARTINFSLPYCGIEVVAAATAGSGVQSLDGMDQPDITIAVPARAAYDLYLTRTLKHATLVRCDGLPGARDTFAAGGAIVLAGLKPAIDRDLPGLPGARILDGRITVVEQAVGTARGDKAAAAIAEALAALRSAGLPTALIEQHGRSGKLIPLD